MHTLDIRRVIANTLDLHQEDIGVLRGDNLIIITIAETHSALLTTHNRGRVMDRLAEVFGPAYVHLGYVRFI
jgi:hypothetical protein